MIQNTAALALTGTLHELSTISFTVSGGIGALSRWLAGWGQSWAEMSRSCFKLYLWPTEFRETAYHHNQLISNPPLPRFLSFWLTMNSSVSVQSVIPWMPSRHLVCSLITAALFDRSKTSCSLQGHNSARTGYCKLQGSSLGWQKGLLEARLCQLLHPESTQS